MKDKEPDVQIRKEDLSTICLCIYTRLFIDLMSEKCTPLSLDSDLITFSQVLIPSPNPGLTAVDPSLYVGLKSQTLKVHQCHLLSYQNRT